jgi:acetyl esterase/lipase
MPDRHGERLLKTHRVHILASVIMALFAAIAAAQETPYTQRENVVYGEAHGVGLVMDIFTPRDAKNGIGIVDVISGAWYSDRGKIRDHTRAQTFHILCRKGYTVFAIRPGSVTKFSVSEMLANLNQGIRWVKDHSQEFGIEPERMGMMGASAGGHLACLAAVTADDAKTDAAGSATTPGTRVKAVAVFFPPTDFLQYGGTAVNARADDRLGQLVRKLAFPQGLGSETDEEVNRKVMQISPARLVTPKAPPFLLIHGDADPVVPLQQSEVMLAALKEAGVPAELIVKKGGAHPWPTLHEEIEVLADWFDKQLKTK